MSEHPNASGAEAHDEAPPRRGGGVKADINVTPLVDVVLVLLIIFMVVTPQMEAGVAVDLPPANNPDAESSGLGAVTVSLSKDGAIHLDKDRIEAASLAQTLAALHEEKPHQQLVLKADKAVAYGEVREVFKTCQGAGFPGVSLQVIEMNGER